MSNLNLTGTGIAIVTPFNSEKKVDYKALEKLVEFNISGGVDYIVVLGTTGESATLNKEEKKAVVKCVVDTVNGRVPVVLGHGGNNTAEIIEGYKNYDYTGISAILSVSPYYNKPNQEGIYRHYKAVAEASPLPVILYNVPGRTGSNVTAETTLRLAHDCSKIVAIKEASGSLEQCMRIIKNKPENFLVISGDDNLTLPMIASGASGVISVVGQAFPKDFSNMVREALKGNYSEARRLHYKTFEITEMLFADGNPGGIKAALKISGLIEDDLREPLYKINDALFEKLKKAIETYN